MERLVGLKVKLLILLIAERRIPGVSAFEVLTGGVLGGEVTSSTTTFSGVDRNGSPVPSSFLVSITTGSFLDLVCSASDVALVCSELDDALDWLRLEEEVSLFLRLVPSGFLGLVRLNDCSESSELDDTSLDEILLSSSDSSVSE